MVTQAHEYAGGEIAKFVAYSVPLGEGEVALLNEGDRVRIEQVNDDGGMVAIPVDAKNKPVEGRQGDTVFPEEVELVKAVAKPKAAAKSKAKPKTKTAAKPATKAAAKTKGKAATKKAAPKTKGKAKTKPPAASEAQGEPAAVAIKHDAEVVAILEEEGALKAAKHLIARAEETYFTLGGVLHEIDEHGIYEKAGFEGKKGFHAYVEQELGIEYRKARYLINIYHVFREVGISRKALASIGWSKAKELARLSPSDLKTGFDLLVEFAKDNTREDLIAHIKKNYVVATRDGERVKSVRYNFAFTGDEATIVERAMTKAKKMVDEGDPNKALEHICGEWLNMSEGVDSEPTFADVDALIEYASENFEVVLTQVDEG